MCFCLSGVGWRQFFRPPNFVSRHIFLHYALVHGHSVSCSLLLIYDHYKQSMPKVKRIRAAALDAQQTRHAPLGQVMQADESRGKFAVAGKTRPRKDSHDDQEEELLDEKTSSRILEMSREQQLEIEMEEQRQRRAEKQAKESRRYADSDDEEEQEDEQSVLLDEYETE